MKRRQTGATTVEFAIVGALLILIMLTVIEFGRALFSFSALSEGTRRGARVAAVCPLNDPAIAKAATFVSMPGLTTSNVTTEYLNENGAVIANPAGNFLSITYVRVRIVNYQYQMLIPFLNIGALTPSFATTFPKESLGVPRSGVITPCTYN
jgi:Flp pilus assembly protein TadG